MDSNLQHHQQQQMSSGLTRYRSAPSSYFASLLSSTSSGGGGGYAGDDLDQLINSRVSNRDVFSRFMANVGIQESNPTNFASNQQSTASNMTMQSHFGVSMNPQREIQQQQQQPKQEQQQLQQPKQEHQQERNDYSFMSNMSQGQTQAQQGHTLEASSSAMDNSYRLVASINSDRLTQMKTGGGRNPSLIRHSSSPAGLFDQIDIEYEFGAMRGMGNSGAGNNASAEVSVSSSRFKNDMDFSSGRPSSLGEMTHITEPEVKSMGGGGSGKGEFSESRRNDGSYITGFTDASWDESAILSDEFLKGLGDSDHKLFSSVNASDSQNNEGQNRPPTLLSHHLSLPSSSAELSVLEKLSEDTILCKTRAKRGFATHPRSIAERVRRTRISERMRKLQELVPNMDTQTNTADMLDLAVDYIKDLEKQLKALQENRAKCTCSDR